MVFVLMLLVSMVPPCINSQELATSYQPYLGYGIYICPILASADH